MADRKKNRDNPEWLWSDTKDHSRIISVDHTAPCLDTAQLHQLEQAFRKWAAESPRADVRFSRRRILITFLLIRYTGAKLNEVLGINPLTDIDIKRHAVTYGSTGPETGSKPRMVHLSKSLCHEILNLIHTPLFKKKQGQMPGLDPGFVRRKFYERAAACGFAKELGGPEAIRRARAVELMQANLPLPAVQKILGHTSSNLTSSYVAFSESEIQDIARRFMEKESGRRTSARNSFFCKVTDIVTGDIQTRVEMVTMEGHPVVTVITNDSVQRLGLVPGKWIVAEVKAPMVMLQDGASGFKGSAENRFKGRVTRITRGKINTECIVRVSDTTQICAVMSSSGTWLSRIRQDDPVWAVFSCFSVVLHLD
ncbi:MAG: TOBE domain-containing protein [Desulfotignum sp.]|nr:TOBE domain-containing protein [Desulfotignum sp.]